MLTMRHFGLLLGLLCLPVRSVLADGTYRTRPDLSPVKLNITLPCHADTCEPGFLLVAPFLVSEDGSRPDDRVSLQSGAYILTDTGDLVWSGFGYYAGWVADLQVVRWQDRDVLAAFEGVHNGPHGHGHGRHTLLGPDYSVLRALRAGGHEVSDKHEFEMTAATGDEKRDTALIQIFHPLQQNLGAFGGSAEQTWIVDARFQELDVATGKVLFEWHSLDHVSPNESALPLPLGIAGVGRSSATAWDYFHINSVTKGADGHYLVSARHASTLFKINGTDGSIIWRLGGEHSDFLLGPGVRFGFQHHARYLPTAGSGDSSREVISLFDNSIYGSESANDPGSKEIRIYPYSRGKHIALDHVTGTATLVHELRPPFLSEKASSNGNDSDSDSGIILTHSQGSLQSLPVRGGSLVNWGSEGQMTEYDAAGTPVFHAFFTATTDGHDSRILAGRMQNYRAFRFPWTGFSPETPAVLAEVEEDSDGSTVRFFVSWNGDTETRVWHFFWDEEEHPGQPSHTVTHRQASVARQGFETTMKVRCPRGVHIFSMHTEAADASGRVLTTSASVAVQKAAYREKEASKFPVYTAEQHVLESAGEL